MMRVKGSAHKPYPLHRHAHVITCTRTPLPKQQPVLQQSCLLWNSMSTESVAWLMTDAGSDTLTNHPHKMPTCWPQSHPHKHTHWSGGFITNPHPSSTRTPIPNPTVQQTRATSTHEAPSCRLQGTQGSAPAAEGLGTSSNQNPGPVRPPLKPPRRP